jgi:hypothetical protein
MNPSEAARPISSSGCSPTSPAIARHAPTPKTAIALGMSEAAVKVAVHRLRRRFRDLLRQEIASTVSSADEIEDELRHLWSAVAR